MCIWEAPGLSRSFPRSSNKQRTEGRAEQWLPTCQERRGSTLNLNHALLGSASNQLHNFEHVKWNQKAWHPEKTSARLDLSPHYHPDGKKDTKISKWPDQNHKAVSSVPTVRLQVSLHLAHFLLNCLSLGTSVFLSRGYVYPLRLLHGTVERIKRDKRSDGI